MTQEQAKDLMDKMDFPAFNPWGYELMLKFYQAAQRDAYERAAQAICDIQVIVAGNHSWTGLRVQDQCLNAIRKLAEGE